MEEKNKQAIQTKDIIKELKLDALPIEKQAELVERMSKLIYKRILFRILDKFSEEETVKLNKLLKKKNYEKVDECIRDKAPEFVTILKEEIEKFQKEMIKAVRS